MKLTEVELSEAKGVLVFMADMEWSFLDALQSKEMTSAELRDVEAWHNFSNALLTYFNSFTEQQLRRVKTAWEHVPLASQIDIAQAARAKGIDLKFADLVGELPMPETAARIHEPMF